MGRKDGSSEEARPPVRGHGHPSGTSSVYQIDPAGCRWTSAGDRLQAGTRPRGSPEGPGPGGRPPQASPIPGARGRPRGSRARLAATRVPGVCFPRPSREPAHPVPPYLAFSSASTARRSTVLKRLFMARVRVATAVLPAADPTHGRLASAHARLARLYGSPDDPLFLEAKVRHVAGTLGSSMISSVLFCFVFFPLY